MEQVIYKLLDTSSSNIWNGPVKFFKLINSITENVIITRGNSGGHYRKRK